MPDADPVIDLDSIVSAVRAAGPDALVAVDFDGTLAPLVPDPEQSRPVDGTLEALSAIAATGARVAVITGRDVSTVLRLSGLDVVPGIVLAGIYGIETWQDGALDTPDTPPALAELAERLPRVLAEHDADPLIWIEDKRLSLVVHARRADDPDAALAPVTRAVQALADELGLEMHPGRDVLELRVTGFDKAGALRRLAGERRAVLYLGDDLGDLPAFAETRRMRDQGVDAFSVGVRASGVAEVAEAADVCVDTADDAVTLLRRLG